MALNESTKKNLRRKSGYIDSVQIYDNQPLFSWLEINVTELCNRTCIFCPRQDPSFYPNQNLHLPLSLANKISDELGGLNYEGAVVLCGYGEPLLHPTFSSIVETISKNSRVEIVTNGDHLTSKNINKLISLGASYFVVSMYDGPEQVDKFQNMFLAAGCDESHFILRDRWHSEKDAFGLKLTNRAGTVEIGDQDPIDDSHPCHYPAYSMTIDWNGDVLLCVQDWNKRVKLGNLNFQTLLEVWLSSELAKWRKRLMEGRRSKPPCNKCNADGTLHGYNHVAVWKNKFFNKKIAS
tara:strand:- start:394 stop:1275 length:882 start_codon:yes stop_codon:yes gene_type:complete